MRPIEKESYVGFAGLTCAGCNESIKGRYRRVGDATYHVDPVCGPAVEAGTLILQTPYTAKEIYETSNPAGIAEAQDREIRLAVLGSEPLTLAAEDEEIDELIERTFEKNDETEKRIKELEFVMLQILAVTGQPGNGGDPKSVLNAVRAACAPPKLPNPVLGRKDDAEKPRWDLLPFRALARVVDVLTFGAKKYAPDNWRHVHDARWRYYRAAQGHMIAWWLGAPPDSDTGMSHLAHAACCVLFLCELEDQGKL